MFDIGWSELLVVGLVALVVVGPKELPGLMRTIGGYIRKIKQTASQFQRQFEEAVEESEIGKLKSSVDELSRDLNPDKIMGEMGIDDELMDEFDPDNYETFDPDKWNEKVMEEQGERYKPPSNTKRANESKNQDQVAPENHNAGSDERYEAASDDQPAAKSGGDDSTTSRDTVVKGADI